MKKHSSFLIARLFLVLSLWLAGSSLYADVFSEKKDSLAGAVFPDSVRIADSLERERLLSRIQEMELNEIMLKERLESSRKAGISDSLARVRRKLRIDSLRRLTPGTPLVIGKDTLFSLYARKGGLSVAERVAEITRKIHLLGKTLSASPDSIFLFKSEYVTDIMCGEMVIMSISDADALWQNVSRDELAARFCKAVTATVRTLQEENSWFNVGKRIFLFVLVLVCLYVLFRLTGYLFRKVRRRIRRLRSTRLKTITIRDYEFLTTRRQAAMLIFLANLMRYAVDLLLLVISVPILFGIFPQTEKLALRILSYILSPVKSIALAVVHYIPNLFTILVIYFCVRYLIRGIGYLAREIEQEKLKITGFYPDWARPTYNIVRFLMYAFMIAMIYPYLPGADTGVFQGISVFVGLIVSLGSSTVIGNIIAGLVITYMRPFKVGDRIKLNDTTGSVIEKTPFVTRLKTPKNELITIPNSFIMSSHTTNYSESARTYGLIIHSTVTIGYDAPWRQVHQLLTEAARRTEGVMEYPEPFVLETELNDYYPVYQINAYVRSADRIHEIYSRLHQNIQDCFNRAGVEIMSPHYRACRDGNASTIPADDRSTMADTDRHKDPVTPVPGCN